MDCSRCLSQIGLCSYSIYLVHFAVIDVIRMALKELALNKVQAGMILLFLIFIAVTAISYFFATLSRRLIELPSIEIGRRLSLHLLPKRSP
jgi:exopolysaccharide production protein ExoZ